jgi:hypothetical protein
VFAFLGRHRVELASPYPPDECNRRLTAATGRQMFGNFGTLPLQGSVDLDLVRVSRSGNSRNSLRAWFMGRIYLAPDGGSIVAGTIGPGPASPVIFALFSVVAVLIGGAMVAAAVSSAVSGHGVPPFLIAPLVIVGIYVHLLVFGPRMVRKDVRRLLDELNLILSAVEVQ